MHDGHATTQWAGLKQENKTNKQIRRRILCDFKRRQRNKEWLDVNGNLQIHLISLHNLDSIELICALLCLAASMSLSPAQLALVEDLFIAGELKGEGPYMLILMWSWMAHLKRQRVAAAAAAALANGNKFST